MNLFKIKELCEKRDGSLTKLSQDIGMSVQNLHRCIRVNQMQAHQLEQIAHILKVPIAYFFDEITHDGNSIGTVNGNGNKVQQGHVNVMQDSQEIEIEHLKIRLEEKERLLEEKERLIQVLMNK